MEPEHDEKPISNFWDKNKNFFLSISCFETRTRIFLSVSRFETRMRISFFQSRVRDMNENFFFQSWALRQERDLKIITILTRMFENASFCFFLGWSLKKNSFVQFRDSIREREYLSINLVFWDENEKKKMISPHWVRKKEAKSHENFWEREFLSCSEWNHHRSYEFPYFGEDKPAHLIVRFVIGICIILFVKSDL